MLFEGRAMLSIIYRGSRMTVDQSVLTSPNNYFDDFAVGRTIKHARGKTISNLENVLLTNLVMNTAQGHFNSDMMEKTAFGQIISFGGVNLSVVLGLASQDCCENALQELALDNIKLSKPVFHGDTLYAYSEVLAKTDDAARDDAGRITFRHYGVNQRGETVLTADRTVLLKRKGDWDLKKSDDSRGEETYGT